MQAVDCTNWRMQTVPDIKHEEDTVLKKEEKKTSTQPFTLSLRLRTLKIKLRYKWVWLVQDEKRPSGTKDEQNKHIGWE